MIPITLVLLSWLAMAVVMAVLWLVQRARSDAGVVDVGWAGGLGVVAVLYALLAPGDPFRRSLVGVLATVWSLRLAAYILTNRVIGKPEDGRYRRCAPAGARGRNCTSSRSSRRRRYSTCSSPSRSLWR